MKQLLKSIILIFTLFITINPSFAGPHNRHSFDGESIVDKARVLKVNPIYETIEVITPEKKCWEEKVVTRERHQPQKRYEGLVVGGILGGVAGHQVGRGRGKDVATVAGSLIGAILGDNISNSGGHKDVSHHYSRHNNITRFETHCDTIETISVHQEIVAYKVKYRYKGNDYWTRTKNHPGKYISVTVNVSPI